MKTISIFLLTLAIFGFAFEANAQALSATPTGNGRFGGSSNAFGGGISMNSGLGGTSGIGSPNGMNSGFGTMNGANSGIGGTNGMGGGGGMNGMSNQQNGGFVGANTNANQFVGASPLGNQNMRMGTQGLGGMNQYGMGNRQMMGQNPYGMGNFGNQNNQTRRLITAWRSDFEYSARPTATISSSVTRQLRETPGVHSLSPLRAILQGRTLILQGAVATEHDKALIERMVKMEPGVDQVQNDLTVGKPDSAASKSSSN